jgi:hypothetical protein
MRRVLRSPPGLFTNAIPVPSDIQPIALVPWNSQISVPAGSLASTEIIGRTMPFAKIARASVPCNVNGANGARSLTVATVTP